MGGESKALMRDGKMGTRCIGRDSAQSCIINFLSNYVELTNITQPCLFIL